MLVKATKIIQDIAADWALVKLVKKLAVVAT